MIRIIQAYRNLLYVRLRKVVIPEWMGRVRRSVCQLAGVPAKSDYRVQVAHQLKD